MRLKHVYVHDILNTTTVVVLQVILLYMDLFIKMSPPMSESQVKESHSHAALPFFAQARVGA